MKIYLTKQKDGILVMARAESEDVIGDLVELITAGSTFYGLSYHDLEKLGDGEHTVPDDHMSGFSEALEETAADRGGSNGAPALSTWNEE